MTPSTKLTTVGQVANFLNNNADVGGRLMLADGDTFSLIAGRNKYKDGVVFHIRNETTKQAYALTGFRPNDRSQGGWKAGDTVQRVIDKADAYIAQFLTPPTRKLTEYPYEDPTVHPDSEPHKVVQPVTASEHLAIVLATLTNAINRTQDHELRLMLLTARTHATVAQTKIV